MKARVKVDGEISGWDAVLVSRLKISHPKRGVGWGSRAKMELVKKESVWFSHADTVYEELI